MRIIASIRADVSRERVSPDSSELILPLGGYKAAEGHLSLPRTLAPSDFDKVNDWFAYHGGKAVLLGRLVPGIRTLISIPAGVCGMSPGRFLLLSGIGTAAWSTVLIFAGYTLGEEFDRVGHWVSPVGNLILGVAFLYYLYRVITFRRHVDPPA